MSPPWAPGVVGGTGGHPQTHSTCWGCPLCSHPVPWAGGQHQGQASGSPHPSRGYFWGPQGRSFPLSHSGGVPQEVLEPLKNPPGPASSLDPRLPADLGGAGFGIEEVTAPHKLPQAGVAPQRPPEQGHPAPAPSWRGHPRPDQRLIACKTTERGESRGATGGTQRGEAFGKVPQR